MRFASRAWIVLLLLLLPVQARAQPRVREIIDASGDGAGNTLEDAHGIVADAMGNVYVAGSASDNVFKIAPSGAVVEIADSGGDGAGHALTRPRGIATDVWGNLYVAGFASHYVFRVTPGGEIAVILDSSGDGLGHFGNAPWGVAVDRYRNVYVTATWYHHVFEITPDGNVTVIADQSGDGSGHGLLYPHGVAVDGRGNVYVTGSASDNAFKITPERDVLQILDATGDGLGHALETPEGIAVDSAGNVYVTGKDSDNVFKVSPGGEITQILDADGDGLGNTLDAPWAVATDGTGDLLVSGQRSHNAFRIEPDGTITQILDHAGDGQGNLYSNPLEFSVFVSEDGRRFAAGDSTHNAFEILPCEGDDPDADGVLDSCDNCPNTANPEQANADSDPSGDLCDCNDDDATIYPGAPEVNDGRDNQCPGDPGRGLVDECSGLSGFRHPADDGEYCWDPQEGATQYEVRRSASPEFAQPCGGETVTEACWVDTTVPSNGEVLHYLNRPTAPHPGSWGQDSQGLERTAICP